MTPTGLDALAQFLDDAFPHREQRPNKFDVRIPTSRTVRVFLGDDVDDKKMGSALGELIAQSPPCGYWLWPRSGHWDQLPHDRSTGYHGLWRGIWKLAQRTGIGGHTPVLHFDQSERDEVVAVGLGLWILTEGVSYDVFIAGDSSPTWIAALTHDAEIIVQTTNESTESAMQKTKQFILTGKRSP